MAQSTNTTSTSPISKNSKQRIALTNALKGYLLRQLTNIYEQMSNTIHYDSVYKYIGSASNILAQDIRTKIKKLLDCWISKNYMILT